MSGSAIGVFDSGVGGLAVLRAVRQRLPSEAIIYVADTLFAPYGERDFQYVADRSTTIAAFLERTGVKALVVACNTATAVAVTSLRETLDLPIVGIEPGIKPAVERSATKTIVVLATQRTIESDAISGLCQEFGDGAQIILQACPGLVELVERGVMGGSELLSLLRIYTAPVRESGADVVVLGCTHFAFLKEQIRALTGGSVEIVEPSGAVARQLETRLIELGIRNESTESGNESFFTSSRDVDEVATTMSLLLGRRVSVACIEY